jgi:D-tagatose-1,6-bisphosphate aldolase subunit GatZ/KbaZ
VGTEVPPPGGEVAEGTCPPPTRVEDVHRAIELFRKAFLSRGVSEAWERVIAIVVQPGVEFGDTKVFDYDASRASALASGLPFDSSLIYEAHSTDYQTPDNLAALVEDHFAILKVGPWLTFAYREAIFALSHVERETSGRRRGVELSQVREALHAEMLCNPEYWESYYKGTDAEVALARAYSFSDRSRYYWHLPAVQRQLSILLRNLSSSPLPATLLSQYLPVEYEALRNGEIVNSPEPLIHHHIRRVLKQYAYACGLRSRT